MAGDAIFIDVVANLLQLVGDQKMGLSIQQLNGIRKLKSDFTIVSRVRTLGNSLGWSWGPVPIFIEIQANITHVINFIQLT